MNPLAEHIFSRGSRWLEEHRKAVVTASVLTLSGFGITAFGIAPLAPDAAELPQTLVTEPVQTLDLAAQIDALAQHDLQLWRSDVTRAGESAERLLYRLGVQETAAATFVRLDPLARKLLSGRTKMLQARTSQDGRLVELVARFPAEDSNLAKTHFSRLTVQRANGVLVSKLETAPLQAGTRLASGSIRTSLYAATDEARLPDNVAAQLAEIFANDIDFHRELRKGDSFSIVYETLSADGQPVVWNEGAGRILAAEFVNKGRAYHALWFEGGTKAQSGYFGLDGKSLRRAFLASPLEFSRITSGFAQRFHPILQRWRAHLGVDYAAPTGTPVRTVGDGVVSFAGWQNGYGKVVEVEHDKQRSTLYAHLSAIEVKRGQRVAQGEYIGKVGSTGWSTGPHLHFEFRVGGVHQDPLLVAKANEEVKLDPASRDRFNQQARLLQTKLDVAETLGGQRTRTE